MGHPCKMSIKCPQLSRECPLSSLGLWLWAPSVVVVTQTGEVTEGMVILSGNSAGKSYPGLFHCPVSYSCKPWPVQEPGCEVFLWFSPSLTVACPRIWFFMSVVEVSHRNLMWSWFHGLVYGSVITEMARNEDKWWLGLLPASQGRCLWRKQPSCLGTTWPHCIRSSLSYLLNACKRVWFLRNYSQTFRGSLVMYELRNPGYSGEEAALSSGGLWNNIQLS